MFFASKISLIAVVVFYSNLVVGWQSITSYVDLARTFFEIMALWGFVNYWKKGEKKWLIESGVMLGLAVSTKLLAVGSLFIFSVLIIIHSSLYAKGPPRRSPFGHLRGVKNPKNLFIGLFVYWVICLLIPLPWFVFSYINTGNPIYPLFTDIYKVNFDIGLLNPLRFASETWNVFTSAADPISPIYIIFLPLLLLFLLRHSGKRSQVPSGTWRSASRISMAQRDSGQARMTRLQMIALYSFLAIVVWYLTPRTGGGRFILPYLPAFSIVVAGVIEQLRSPRRSHGFSASWRIQPATIRGDSTWNLCVGLVVLISIISIFYRGIANSKYIPFIIGNQSKDQFLSSNLNFSFGDFYDTDDYFKKHIKPKDTVLLYGFHNLYYVDFPFIDSSWAKKGDEFIYIALQNAPSADATSDVADGLPKRFKDWEFVYINPKTNVRLYSKGGIRWAY